MANWNTLDRVWAVVNGRGRRRAWGACFAMLVAGALLGQTGCKTQDTAASKPSDKESVTAPETPTVPAPTDQAWVLVQLGDQTPLADAPVTMDIQAGRVTGSTGANRYFATIAFEPPNQVSLGPVGATKMLRMEPEGVMEQEAKLVALLGQVNAYTWAEGESLVLSGPEGQLTFHPVPAPGK